MANKMLIDATHPEETRVVVVRGNRVEEFDFESASRRQLRGNIYLAKVTRVEPSLQAAFVEYGGNRHGFLAFSEIHPDYYQIPVADRQALLDEEERAHRDADDEADRRARNPRGKHSRQQAAARDSVRRSGRTHGSGRSESDEKPSGDESPAEMTPEVVAAGTDAAEDWTAPEAAPVETDISDNMQGLPPESVVATAETDTPAEPEPAAPAEVTAAEPAPWSPAPWSPEPADVPALAVETAATEEHATESTVDSAETSAFGAKTAQPAPAEFENGAPAEEARGHESESADEGDEETEVEEEEFVESVGGGDALEEAQERTPRYRRQYKIQEVIKRRQVMLVQVVKEERGTKGAALTTYLSLAGRYSVLMPNTARGGGISRKITSAEDRKRLKEIAQDLDVPEGMGVILRTAGASRTRAEVKRDFEYLLRMWETVRDLTLRSSAPKLVYEEGSLIKRAIRDLYNKDIDEVMVAGDDGYREAKDFMRMLMPSHAKNVKPYKDTQPVFTRFGIESQLDAMFSPIVQLRSGGYVVINQTEALVAIDVNSGRATREHHIEDTALKTNLEAAEEVSRQLRLRDLAGLIVIDFIDMDEKRNNRTVERKLKECLKNDRARIQVGRISHFGLLEMSRQRIRSGVLESSTEKCPHCGGTGHVRSISSVTLQLLRALEEAMLKGATHNMIVRTRTDIAIYVLNHKRAHLRDLENRFRVNVTINADATISGQVPFVVERGEEVHTLEAARTIAQQSVAATPVIEEEEFEPGDEEETEQRAETEAAGEDGHDGENGGRRKRRRRRRGGRRDEQGEETNGEQAETVALQPASTAESGDEDDESESEGEEAEAEAAGDAESGRGNGEDGRQRRRRGRRGGRRNRREGGEPRENGEAAAEAADHEQPAEATAQASFELNVSEEAGGEEAGGREAPAAEAAAPAEPVEGWRQWANAQQQDAVEPPATPEPAAPVAAEQPETTTAEAPAAEAETERPRRRSTVREAAPVAATIDRWEPVHSQPAENGAGSPTVELTEAAKPAEPAPAELTVETTAEEPAAPRRTGWWAKRVFGKG